MPKLVFVSHASDQAALAHALVETLEARGPCCWIAPRDIPTGSFYAEEIIRALNAASLIVVLLSHASVTSQHVTREVERGCSKGLPVLAARIEPADLSLALEYFLSSAQWLDVQSRLPELWKYDVCEAVARMLPERTPEHGEGADRDEMLFALWSALDPQLQNAFAVAYNKKRVAGSRRISTKDLFQALQLIDDDEIDALFMRLPPGAMPEVGGIHPNQQHSIIEEQPLLSDCVSESLHRFGTLVQPRRRLKPADVFVDIAKHGHGESVRRLREHGVDGRQIEKLIQGQEIIRPV